MKKALKLLLMYFILLILGIVFGTLFYSFYLSLLNFVVGQQLEIFSVDNAMKALFTVSIVMCFLLPPLLSYYRIRHMGGWLQTLSYVLIVIITYALLLPSVLQLRTKFYQNYPTTNNFTHLSGNFFRNTDDKIYYFTNDFRSNPVTGDDTTTIIIDTSKNENSVTIENIKESSDFILYEKAKPYKEILIKNAFASKLIGEKSGLTVLAEDVIFNYQLGFTFYLGFLAVCIAFASVYAITKVFKWKLLNSFFVIVDCLIIILTSQFYYHPAVQKLVSRLGNNSLMEFLGKYVDQPVLSSFYIIFSFVLIVIGVVTAIVRKHQKKQKAGGAK